MHSAKVLESHHLGLEFEREVASLQLFFLDAFEYSLDLVLDNRAGNSLRVPKERTCALVGGRKQHGTKKWGKKNR